MEKNITKLLYKLCSSVVPFSEIGAIAEVGTGSSNGNEADENGEYPFFVRSQTVKAKNHYEYDEEAIIIPGEGGIGDIFHYVNGKYALHQRVYRIHFTSPLVDVRFAYYYMSANFKAFIMRKAVSATVTSIRKPMIEQFRIPIPPLAVQQEIVRILDSFTELTTELNEKLTAELTARRKQYEHYRDELLTFGAEVPIFKLSDCVLKVSSGSNKSKSSSGKYPVYGSTGVIAYTDKYQYCEACILVARVGANAGYVHIASGKYDVSDNTLIVQPKEQVDLKYLYYVLQKMNLNTLAVGGGQPLITGGKLKELKIQIPSRKIQDEIVVFLDRFDAICNDLTAGLPAEIAARQKQYEYYRDKLLTFKELDT